MKIKLQFIKCERCGHTWVPRKAEIRICPNCKSAYWDTPKVKNATKSNDKT